MINVSPNLADWIKSETNDFTVFGSPWLFIVIESCLYFQEIMIIPFFNLDVTQALNLSWLDFVEFHSI